MQRQKTRMNMKDLTKSVGIDFNIPVKKREKKNPEIISEPVYLEEHYNEFRSNKNSKIFEEIVDMMMLDYFDESFKKKIKGLSNDKKRMMILALLDKERNLFLKAKALIPDNIKKVPKLQHIKELILILRDYVHVGEIEKKKLGEVMTPLELVKDMLHTLPEEVWSNPNLKWLDSCNGTGPFLAMVVYKLMQGLRNWEPDEDKRYKHIMENMIYAGELQPKNMFLWITLMDPYNELNMNVYTGSFIDSGFDKHMKDVWGIDKFDIIVGNPPYQERKEGNKKTQPLWHIFVKKSLELLIDNGYLCMVHPSGWRNVDGVFKDTQLLLKSKKMLSLKLHSFGQGQEIFNAAINFDYYCLNNSDCKNNITRITTVSGVDEYLDISNLEFISDENISEIQSLVAKDGEERVNLIWDSTYHTQKEHVVKEVTAENKYPVIYTVKSPDKGCIPTFWYSNHDKKHFGIPKVVWANGASGVFVDEQGSYGLTQFAYAIIDDVSNLENIKKAMMTDKFIKEVMGFKKSLGDKYNRKIISTFRKDFWKEFI